MSAQPRPFNEAEKEPAAHPELGGELTLLARDILQRLQEQPRRHWHVEKDVRQQDALQAIRREGPLQPERLAEGGKPALTSIDAKNAKYRHQHRQDQRHGAQAQQHLPSGEATAVEGASKKYGGHDGEQGRKKRLPEREADDVPQIAIVQQRRHVGGWRVKPQRQKCTQGDGDH